MKEAYFEEALLSLLNMGQGIALDFEGKKVLLFNNGLQIEEIEVEKYTKEEAEKFAHGTIFNFSGLLEMEHNTAKVN